VIRDVQLFRDNPPDNNLTHEIIIHEILVHIRQLKNTKAPGPDKIKPIILKQLPEPARQALLIILDNCLNASYLPKTWKTASTIMIPKPGKDPHNPLSYRPISLLNIMGKILEKILNNCLKTILETDNIIPQQQFGFRPQRSTINPILELHTDTTRHSNLKECTIAVLLGIERAFDKVWHDGLLHKLISLRLNTIAIQTLYTLHKLPTYNNRLINRIPKNPIRKLRHPPTALLSKLYPDLPETLQDIVENTPVSMR
jgi:hypothetical protein